MIYYSLFTYSLMCVAFIFTMLSFIHLYWGIYIQPIIKAIVGIIIFSCSFIQFNDVSIAMLFYAILDTPSFLLLLVCIFSVLRSFINQIGFVISYRGFLFLFVLWLIFGLNLFSNFDLMYGSTNYNVLIAFFCITISYCFDRTCGFFMFISFVLWLFFSSSLNIYNAIIDSIVAIFGCLLQSIPMSKDNFHMALLKPKSKFR